MENNNKWCHLAVYRVRDKIRFQTVLPGAPGPALTDGCLRGTQGNEAVCKDLLENTFTDTDSRSGVQVDTLGSQMPET